MKFYKNLNTNEAIIEEYNELGEGFVELVPNTVDAAQEKHVPVVEVKENNLVLVKVGEVEHPMQEEHYIMWIAQVIGETLVKKIDLNPGDKPQALFENKEDAEYYAYCNLHGLWKN